MNFTIRIPRQPRWDQVIVNMSGTPAPNEPACITVDLLKSNPRLTSCEVIEPGAHFIFLGDFIFDQREYADEKTYLTSLAARFTPEQIKHIPGFYYIIQILKKERAIRVFNSVFSILPVYYHQHNGTTYISSSLRLIQKMTPASLSPDPLFLLEKSLFNYSLFNQTWFKEIRLLASNSYLELNSKLKIIKHTDMTDHYSASPIHWQTALDDLSDGFIATARKYLPRDRFIATLTGGFDSRAIVGVALKAGLKFPTYSYGGSATDDIRVPRLVAEKLGFEHQTIIVDEEFARNKFWRYGNDFLLKSEGNGNLSRAHYSYAAEVLSQHSDFLVSGNFGSEIIRAMKMSGVMVAQPIFDIFAIEELSQLRKIFLRHPGLCYLNLPDLPQTMELLMDEIAVFRAGLPSGLSQNQKFYVYIFEEVFRKYFGPEIVVENYHFKHRAPFIDFAFIAGVLKTDLAGVYSQFRETNPFKRFHGQILYAHIMQKTCPKLLDIILDRNYRPRDFLSYLGRMNIISGYLRQCFKQLKKEATPGYATLCTQQNLEKMKLLELNPEIFNQDYYNTQFSGGWSEDQSNFSNMISTAMFYAELFGREQATAFNQSEEADRAI